MTFVTNSLVHCKKICHATFASKFVRCKKMCSLQELCYMPLREADDQMKEEDAVTVNIY